MQSSPNVTAEFRHTLSIGALYTSTLFVVFVAVGSRCNLRAEHQRKKEVGEQSIRFRPDQRAIHCCCLEPTRPDQTYCSPIVSACIISIHGALVKGEVKPVVAIMKRSILCTSNAKRAHIAAVMCISEPLAGTPVHIFWIQLPTKSMILRLFCRIAVAPSTVTVPRDFAILRGNKVLHIMFYHRWAVQLMHPLISLRRSVMRDWTLARITDRFVSLHFTACV